MCIVCRREDFRLCHLSTQPGGATKDFHKGDWLEGVRAEGRSGVTQADCHPRMLSLAVIEDRFGVAGVTSGTQGFWFQGLVDFILFILCFCVRLSEVSHNLCKLV